MKTSYDSVDFLKFVCALLIVAIHTQLFKDTSETLFIYITDGISRLGVPLFFTLSAFFLARKGWTKTNVIKYTKRIMILYGCWLLLESPLVLKSFFLNDKHTIIESIWRFIHSFFVQSTFSGSWFLMSSVFSAWVVYAILLLKNKYDNNKILSLIYSGGIFACVSICYGIAPINSVYYGIIDSLNFTSVNNIIVNILIYPSISITVGIPYFILGAILFNKEKQLTALSYHKIITMLTVTIGLLLIEIWSAHTHGYMDASDGYLMLILCTVPIMAIILKTKIKIPYALLMRKVSIIFYLSHFVWLTFASKIEGFMPFMRHTTITRYLLIITLCSLTSAFILYLSNVKRFMWVRNYY